MDSTFLTELNILIDKEISDYTTMKDLYNQKKQILISHDMDELAKIDEKITMVTDSLKKIKEDKDKLLQLNGNIQYKITDMIELSAKIDTDLAKKFSIQKEQIKKLSDEISILEQTNYELIKLGLNFTKQMLNFISKDDVANTGNYNNQGQINELNGYSSIEQNV